MDSVEYMPELDISIVNSALYNYVPDLEKCRVCTIALAFSYVTV